MRLKCVLFLLFLKQRQSGCYFRNTHTVLPGLEVLPIVFFFCGTPPLFAQDWVLKNYHAQNGLPTSNVYQCFQDSKGFMWFATEKGLSRFDGYSFTNFTMSDGLSDNEIFSLFEDSRGRLWCLTFNGKPCFWYNGRFYNPDTTPFLKQLSCKSYLSSIAEDEHQNIWLSSERGEARKLDASNHVSKVILESIDASIQLNLNKLYPIHDTLYYQTSRGILSKYMKIPFQKKKVLVDCKKLFYQERQPLRTSLIQKNVLIGFFDNTLFAFHIPTRQFLDSLTLNIDQVLSICCIRDEVWLCTRNGVYQIDYSENRFQLRQRHLEGHAVGYVAKDFEGNMWFSTHEQGVFFKASNEVWCFGKKHGLISQDIQSIGLNAKKELLVGFRREGIAKITGKQIHTNYIISKELNNLGAFYEIIAVGKDRIMCANTIGLLMIENATISYVPELPSKSVVVDKDGIIWVGTAYGLYGLDYTSLRQIALNVKDSIRKANIRREEIHKKLQKYRWSDVRVTKLFTTRQGQIYIGRNDGLFMLSNQNKIVPVSFNQQINTRVTDMTETENGTLWIATDGNGVFSFREGKLKNMSLNKNYFTNNCYALDLDKDGNLWIATSKGAYSIHTSTPTIPISRLSFENGLSSDEIKDLVVNGDTIWLASQNGLMFFNRKKIHAIQSPPPIHLTDFLLFGKPEKKNKSTFHYNENNIQISFVGISYQNNRDIRYKYRLNPKDAWIETKNKTIDLSTLVPNTYRFEVTARTSDSNWNPTPAYISFTINKPFWLELWFIAFLTSLILVGIVFLVRARYKQLREKTDLENKAKLLKIQALIAQMNPHFVFNVLSAIQGLIYKQNPFMAAKYLAKFSKLIRMILYQSREKYISLSEEIDTITYYLELQQLRFENKFDYSIEVDETISLDTTAIPPMLAQPFIENAIEHGIMHKKEEKGFIGISFTKINEEIMLEIKDNGVGLQKSRQINQELKHKPKGSLGVYITQERLEILFKKNKSIVIEEIVENEQVKGVKIMLLFPIESFF